MVESVTITDNRNGQSIEIPIVDGGVAADQWSKLLPGVWFYDPAFMTTASAESAITYRGRRQRRSSSTAAIRSSN